MTEGIIAFIVFVYENLGYIVQIVELIEEGRKIIQIFTDEDGDGEPDDPDEPFIIIDPEEAVQTKSFIIMNSDGTMTVYDESGNITAEDCDTAYSLWISKNGIMDKPIVHYTVTEGLLLIGFIVGSFVAIRKIFRRRRYHTYV